MLRCCVIQRARTSPASFAATAQASLSLSVALT
jgi:hypothetical protein